MKKVISTAALCLLTMVFAANALAAIVGYSGSIEQKDQTSLDLELNAYQSDQYIRAFEETQNIKLRNDLYVNQLGIAGTFAHDEELTSGVISKYTKVQSHLVHFDPYIAGLKKVGSIEFSEKILGLIFYESPPEYPGIHSLTDSDQFGLASVFSTHMYRGIENFNDNVTQDIFTISDDLKTLTVDLWAGNIMDEVRVITAVPIPGAVWLLGSGLLGLLGLRRRVKK